MATIFARATLAKAAMSYDGRRRSLGNLSRELSEAARVEKAMELNTRNEEFKKDQTRSQMVCTKVFHELAYGKHEPMFTTVMIGFIVVAGVLVGLQSYQSLSSSYSLLVIDRLVLTAFTFELFVKIVAEGRKPWRFFWGGPNMVWNWFDFLIVLFSMPFITIVKNLYLLRLVRLARLFKLLKKIPQLRMIIMGLLDGLRSIVYIIFLLLLVFYIYAIAGIYAFGFNDPFHFSSVGRAMLTLFVAATFDSWSDLMYLNVYGCQEYPFIYATDPEEKEAALKALLWCEAPSPSYVVGTMYWVTFIVMSIVMVALFVGTVTMSMYDSMEETKRQLHEVDRSRRIQEEARRVRLLKMGRKTFVGKQALNKNRKLRHYLLTAWGRNGRIKQSEIFRRESGSSGSNRRSSSEGPGGSRSSDGGEGLAAMGMDGRRRGDTGDAWGCLLGAFEMGLQVAAKTARSVLRTSTFTRFIIMVIVAAGVSVGLQTSATITEDPFFGRVLHYADQVILMVFMIEVVLKVLSEGNQPWKYLRSAWNVFDLLIVLGSLIPGTGAKGLLPMLRLLRLLRVLKLVKSLPQLQIIVQALLNGLRSIGFIGVIIFLFFYVFGIIGVMLFSENDEFNFGSLHMGMQTLVRVVTLCNWSEVMYKNMYGCDVFTATTEDLNSTCRSPRARGVVAAAYFVFFVVVGAWVLLTLFVGVVTTAMEEAREDHEIQTKINKRVQRFMALNCVSEQQVWAYQQAYRVLDIDNDGVLDQEELCLGLSSVGIDFHDDQHYRSYLRKVDGAAAAEGGTNAGLDLHDFIEFMFLIDQDVVEISGNHPEKREEDRTFMLRRIIPSSNPEAAATQTDLNTTLVMVRQHGPIHNKPFAGTALMGTKPLDEGEGEEGGRRREDEEEEEEGSSSDGGGAGEEGEDDAGGGYHGGGGLTAGRQQQQPQVRGADEEEEEEEEEEDDDDDDDDDDGPAPFTTRGGASTRQHRQ